MVSSVKTFYILGPLSVNVYLCVHTEIDIQADSGSSRQLAGVDSLTRQRVDQICLWKFCSEVTGGTSAGAIESLSANRRIFDKPILDLLT